MRRLFLIRAYGDFVIAIRAIVQAGYPNDIQLVVSNHLAPLYSAINAWVDTTKIQIEFVDFGIENSQLNLFTNRHFFQQTTLKQISKIRQYLKQHSSAITEDLIEQSFKKQLFEIATRHQYKAIVGKKGVYASYAQFFNFQEQMNGFANPPFGKILILPDARIQKRNLPQDIVQSIIHQANEKNITVQIAYFKRISQVNALGKPTTVQFKTDLAFTQGVYDNFKELIQLIQSADFIIGADSLPIHLSQFLHKPHFILYPDNGSKAFFTPYALIHNSHCEFNEYNKSSIPFLTK